MPSGLLDPSFDVWGEDKNHAGHRPSNWDETTCRTLGRGFLLLGESELCNPPLLGFRVEGPPTT